MPDLHLTVVNKLPDIRLAAGAVETFGRGHGLPERLTARLGLALDEVLTNLVSYGFPDGGRHEIAIHLRLAEGRLTMSVTDDGIAFDPLDLPAPDLGLAVEDRPIGGLGIHFVRTVMDEVRYAREAGRNVLTMEVAVAPPTERRGEHRT